MIRLPPFGLFRAICIFNNILHGFFNLQTNLEIFFHLRKNECRGFTSLHSANKYPALNCILHLTASVVIPNSFKYLINGEKKTGMRCARFVDTKLVEMGKDRTFLVS